MTAPRRSGTTAQVSVRAMIDHDAAPVLAIYQAGIDTGQATFETAAPDWAGFCAGTLPDHRLVAAAPDTGDVLGWAALSPVSDRAAAGAPQPGGPLTADHAGSRGAAACYGRSSETDSFTGNGSATSSASALSATSS